MPSTIFLLLAVIHIQSCFAVINNSIVAILNHDKTQCNVYDPAEESPRDVEERRSAVCHALSLFIRPHGASSHKGLSWKGSSPSDLPSLSPRTGRCTRRT
jgi:hypothetical protein